MLPGASDVERYAGPGTPDKYASPEGVARGDGPFVTMGLRVRRPDRLRAAAEILRHLRRRAGVGGHAWRHLRHDPRRPPELVGDRLEGARPLVGVLGLLGGLAHINLAAHAEATDIDGADPFGTSRRTDENFGLRPVTHVLRTALRRPCARAHELSSIT